MAVNLQALGDSIYSNIKAAFRKVVEVNLNRHFWGNLSHSLDNHPQGRDRSPSIGTPIVAYRKLLGGLLEPLWALFAVLMNTLSEITLVLRFDGPFDHRLVVD